MAALIRAAGLTKRYGDVAALDQADVEIGHGVTGLLGANGAGKTTLLGLLLGLHRPDGGRVEVLGLDPVTAGPEVRERVGYSPEHHVLPPEFHQNPLSRQGSLVFTDLGWDLLTMAREAGFEDIHLDAYASIAFVHLGACQLIFKGSKRLA